VVWIRATALFLKLLLDASAIAVVSLRPMFRQFVIDNNNTNTTRTNHLVTGRWWLSGEREPDHTH